MNQRILEDQSSCRTHPLEDLISNLQTELHSERTAPRAFLTLSSSVSDQDIKDLVIQLNQEVYQLSASMIDKFTFSSVQHVSSSRKPDLLGQRLEALLRRMKDHPDVLDVLRGFAIQESLLRICAGIIMAWSMRPKLSTALGKLSGDIYATNDPRVAARWRALTRAQSKYKDPEAVVSFAVDVIIRDLAPVLSFLGAFGESDESHLLALRDTYANRIQYLARAAIQLDRAMYEDHVESQLELAVVDQSQHFEVSLMEEFDQDFSSLIMENIDNNEYPEDGIICMYELGLRDTCGVIFLKPVVVRINSGRSGMNQ
ncbi:hypothetical protein CPB85DRAFT_1331445 [Mucidula mucida]|nr:hypothetical protein CPB85DRAFT_1331445 [Mucidula mucida]